MKSFACHRLYDAQGRRRGLSVVSVDESGKVLSFADLDGEQQQTEWIGGIVILSSLEECVLGPDLASQLKVLAHQSGSPLYAWHLSDVDVSNEAFTENTVLRKLQ